MRDRGSSIHVLPASPVAGVECAVCGAHFELRYAFQQVAARSEVAHVCAQACREQLLSGVREALSGRPEPVRIAVLNQKGGTGKTTTAVSLAAGLAEIGRRVLLVDTDAQGHVAVSLGVKGERSLYHVLVEGADPGACAVPVTEHLHVITSSTTLASAELHLARMDEGRDRLLRDRMRTASSYDYVILDCGPSLSVLNLNALSFADKVLVPVSCDFLSLVGVRQVLRTVKYVNELLLHPVEILGVLPTFYDQRNRISDESVRSLQAYFPGKVLPPIRVNTRLKEAPSHGQTIFQYAPDSRGADDYRRVVKWVMDHFESPNRRGHAKEATG